MICTCTQHQVLLYPSISSFPIISVNAPFLSFENCPVLCLIAFGLHKCPVSSFEETSYFVLHHKIIPFSPLSQFVIYNHPVLSIITDCPSEIVRACPPKIHSVLSFRNLKLFRSSQFFISILPLVVCHILPFLFCLRHIVNYIQAELETLYRN